MRDIADADCARDRRRESLEMGDLARLVIVVLEAAYDPQRVAEAPEVDASEIDAEEAGSGDQPDDDQGDVDLADRD